MAIVFVQDVDGGNQQMYDKIQEKLNAKGNRPDGLIIHTAGPTDTGWRVVDVWESADHLERFRDQRLMPAISASIGQLPNPPQIKISEVYDLIK